MIRKQAALFFILLAVMVIVAHAVVPHHHHKSQVCIETIHCENHTTAHQHNTTDDNHQHDGEKDTGFCILKQLVILPSNQEKQECKWPHVSDNQFLFDGFQAVLLNSEFQLFDSPLSKNIGFPLTTPIHSVFVNTSLGLRAPPTV
jgi:hypothetical protein